MHDLPRLGAATVHTDPDGPRAGLTRTNHWPAAATAGSRDAEPPAGAGRAQGHGRRNGQGRFVLRWRTGPGSPKLREQAGPHPVRTVPEKAAPVAAFRRGRAPEAGDHDGHQGREAVRLLSGAAVPNRPVAAGGLRFGDGHGYRLAFGHS